MKFKAVLTDRGLHVLHKGFLPTLEKFGKSCQMLLSPEDVHLVQGAADADGLVVTARLANVGLRLLLLVLLVVLLLLLVVLLAVLPKLLLLLLQLLLLLLLLTSSAVYNNINNSM